MCIYILEGFAASDLILPLLLLPLQNDMDYSHCPSQVTSAPRTDYVGLLCMYGYPVLHF